MGTQAKNRAKLIVMKDKVSDEANIGISPAVVAASMPAAGGTLPIYDETGVLLGYVALYTNPDLT